jgi:beta-glucosidase-like glycosyl hydrolase
MRPAGFIRQGNANTKLPAGEVPMPTQMPRCDLASLVRAGIAALAVAVATQASAQQGSPEERARLTEQQMADDERFGLIHSYMVVVFGAGGGKRDPRVPEHVPQIAGWVKGVPRLGVPDLLLTDAGLGITNPAGGRKGDQATALPSAQILGATFNPQLAYESGVILGREARARKFNVVLDGGMNLARDPRHGRNFESPPWWNRATGPACSRPASSGRPHA